MATAAPARRPAASRLSPHELRPGDLLLSTTRHWESWLIRWLDAGAFSHAGLYDGERVIVSGANGIERRTLYPCDVYRFRHGGRLLGAGGLDAGELLERARPYLDDPARYRGTSLYLAGLLLIMRRLARPAWRRILVELLGGVLLARIERSVDRHFPIGAVAVTCSELVTRIFCDAGRATGGPYDILVEPDGRHPRPAWPPTSGRFEGLMQDLEEVLGRVNPDLHFAVSRARSAAPAGRHGSVAAGGPLAPACFVSPGDLQHSASFVHVGRYAATPARRRLRTPWSSAAPS